ncbi:PTS system, sugar-specific IIA component [Enterococcus sp. AZ194]|uniref:PTS sugar transporter subunit IIA n=1 Tax=Enterococcus sp. AZ194 TaxID=2774629 RepID=UPI003F286ACE
MFWKKKLKVFAPIDGKYGVLSAVEDEVFSSGMMGQGLAIEPLTETIVAPIDAEVVSASETMRHAIGLRLKNGCELLIHVGIDTVSLKNQGFTILVNEGDKVKQGDPLLKFDSRLIKEAGLQQTVLLIVTDQKGLSIELSSNMETVKAGESLMMVLK